MKDTQNCVQTVADTQDLTQEDACGLLIWIVTSNERLRADKQRAEEDNQALQSVIKSQNAEIQALKDEIQRLHNRYHLAQTEQGGGLASMLRDISQRVMPEGGIIKLDGRRAA